MKKKLLSILICMTIAVGMFPTMAYATVDGTEIENQQVITPEQPEARFQQVILYPVKIMIQYRWILYGIHSQSEK